MIFALQEALVTKLKADAGVVSLLVDRIYDALPSADPAFPYVTIGESLTAPFDTKTTTGHVTEFSFHIWTQYRGRKQDSQIAKAIYDALHRQELTVAGYTTVDVQHIQHLSFLDNDGLTRHGVCRFQITLD